MKNPQKIATGGASNTNTPMLKLLTKFALFEPASEARHIEHCASPEASSESQKATANARTNKTLNVRLNLINDSPSRAREATL